MQGQWRKKVDTTLRRTIAIGHRCIGRSLRGESLRRNNIPLTFNGPFKQDTFHLHHPKWQKPFLKAGIKTYTIYYKSISQCT